MLGNAENQVTDNSLGRHDRGSAIHPDCRTRKSAGAQFFCFPSSVAYAFVSIHSVQSRILKVCLVVLVLLAGCAADAPAHPVEYTDWLTNILKGIGI